MLLEYFSRYIKVTRGVSDSTVRHYITGLNTINTLLRKYDYIVKNVFEAVTVDELNLIKLFTLTNEEFLIKDTVGNRMYSVAFNHYYKFACEDTLFYQRELQKMDIVLPKPQIVSTTQTSWRRNQIIISQVIEGANYCCEHDAKHKTFTSAATGKPYMEGHHLIPMKYQSEFNVGIDVYANIISLCPICHRLLHYGARTEKDCTLTEIYEARICRLKNSGIDLNIDDFLRLVG